MKHCSLTMHLMWKNATSEGDGIPASVKVLIGRLAEAKHFARPAGCCIVVTGIYQGDKIHFSALQNSYAIAFLTGLVMSIALQATPVSDIPFSDCNVKKMSLGQTQADSYLQWEALFL